MPKNLSHCLGPDGPVLPDPCAWHEAPAEAQRLRAALRSFLAAASEGRLRVHLPAPAGDAVGRGAGHFHLAPELFLQVKGWTRFQLPQGEVLLPAGEALVMPPKLMHDERVGLDAVTRSADEAAAAACFANVVLYDDGSTLTCHLAHEVAEGRPGVLHLEARRQAQAGRVQDWLWDAVRLGEAASRLDSPWTAMQVRALIAAVAAGALRALDDPSLPDAERPPEPPLIARVRRLIQNQLGDQTLSVRGLAEQCGCTADYLSHLFSRHSGEHLAAFIVRQRMERAERLLGETAMVGKEIAWACGFATQSYFIRTFRAHFGVTPKAWRAGRDLAVAGV